MTTRNTVRQSLRSVRRHIASEGQKWRGRIFSGIQPTGSLHLGNYFGAVDRWRRLQDDPAGDEMLLSIVDLHAITLPQEPARLSSSILHLTASLLASGIDPNRCTLFQQSKVPQHVLLGWVLGSLTTMPRLYHFPQYKEKSSTLKDVPLGLFTYPVLQAADILLYKSTRVPVGEDQVQHIHLAQHLVHTFNNKYGTTFPIPQCLVESHSGAGRIKSLREPGRKMSKSHDDPKSRIELTDSAEVILSKVKKAVTDSRSEVSYDLSGRPGVSNLIDIHALAVGRTREEVVAEAKGLDTGQFKLLVADALICKLAPIRSEIARLTDSKDYLATVLNEGARKAQIIADQTWAEVRRKIGFEA